VQGKTANLPKEYFSKENQPIVIGCLVKVNYVKDEAETKNSFFSYKNQIEELVVLINSALQIENPDSTFLQNLPQMSSKLAEKITLDSSLSIL
jgi:hypothetical protein